MIFIDNNIIIIPFFRNTVDDIQLSGFNVRFSFPFVYTILNNHSEKSCFFLKGHDPHTHVGP